MIIIDKTVNTGLEKLDNCLTHIKMTGPWSGYLALSIPQVKANKDRWLCRYKGIMAQKTHWQIMGKWQLVFGCLEWKFENWNGLNPSFS